LWCTFGAVKPTSSLTLLVPNWWMAQMFLCVLYASIQSKKNIYILELNCPFLHKAKIVTINDIAITYFEFCSETSLYAISLVGVGLCLVSSGTRKEKKL